MRALGLLTATPGDLVRLGTTAFGGQAANPPGLSGLSIAQLDGYVMAAMSAAGYPAPGSDAWEQIQREFIGELAAAAEAGGDWGFVGALCVASELVGPAVRTEPLFLRIVDRALLVLRSDGVAYEALPEFALRRWEHVQGGEGRGIAAWPATLASTPVPEPGREPAVEELAEKHWRCLARPEPGDHSWVVYAERRGDGSVRAVVEGFDAADETRTRWDWDGLHAPTYAAFLRELGAWLITPPFWAHEDLVPYLPSRVRSRDELRAEAARPRV